MAFGTGFFNNYPGTDLHEIDLHYVLMQLLQLRKDMQEVVDSQAITFADPINWDITSQYPANQVVLDSNGDGYISRQPVPAGIPLSNSNYWTQIFSFNDIADRIRASIALNAGTSATTPEALEVNDLVWWQGDIYRALVAMPAGTAFLEGTNVERYTVDDKFKLYVDIIDDIETEIGNLNDDIAAETQAREDADTELEGTIGTVSDALAQETEDRQSEDTALNARIDAIIESASDVITVTKYGAVGDGVTDDTTAIQRCIDENPCAVIVFPKGTYRITRTIQLWGASGGQYVLLGGSTIIWDGAVGNNSVMFRIAKDYSPTRSSSCRLIGGNIDGDLKADYCVLNEAFYTEVASAKIMNFNKYGIFNGPVNAAANKSTQARYHDCHIFQNEGSYSLGESAAMGLSYSDNVISNIVTNRTAYGFKLYSGGNLFVNCHTTIEYPNIREISETQWNKNAHIIVDPADSGATQENVFTNCYFNVGAHVVHVPNRATSLITRIDNSHYTYYTSANLPFRGKAYLFSGYRGGFVCNDFDVVIGANLDFYDYFPSSMTATVLPRELRIIGNGRHPEASLFSAYNLTSPGDKARPIVNNNFPTPNADTYYAIGAILMTYTPSENWNRSYSAPIYIKWTIADQCLEAVIRFKDNIPTIVYEMCTTSPSSHKLYVETTAKTATIGDVSYTYFPIYLNSSSALTERMSLHVYSLDPYIKCYVRDHLTDDIHGSNVSAPLQLFSAPAGIHTSALRLGSTSLSEAQLQQLLALLS